MRSKKRGFVIACALFFLFAVASVLAAETPTQSTGCYFYNQGSLGIYCKAGTTQEIAKKDCDSKTGCVFANVFKAGSTCSEIPDCKIVTCDAPDPLYTCKEVPIGKCTLNGGKEIPADKKALECTQGCCVIPLPDKLFCAPQLLFKSQCAELASQKQGGQAAYQFNNPSSMTLELCQQQYCKTTPVIGGLTGLIKDVEGQPIANAEVIILGTTLSPLMSDGAGKYLISAITPATYSIKVTANGYLDKVETVSISFGEATTHDFTLQKAAGEAVLSITVNDANAKSLQDITVTWQGPISGTTKTDKNGVVKIPNIPVGTYTILASAIGYSSQEQKKLVVGGDNPLTITLIKSLFQGIEGTTYVQMDKTYDVSIYVDGFFKAKSQYPDGKYSVSLPADGKEHTISATYQNFVSEIKKITVSKDQTIKQDLFLAPLQGECTAEGTNPQKNIEVFTAKPVSGKKQVRLEWQKPCPEVKTYSIEKYEDQSVVAAGTVDGTLTFWDDLYSEWGKTYTYKIRANFDSGLVSKETTSVTITLGDKECEGKYNGDTGVWSSFCLVDKRQTVYTCTDQNLLTPVQECLPLGNSWYCAQSTATTASCKDSGICSVDTTPFGLYSSAEQCYGAADENFCYYDYSKTIANQCTSCASVKSCFDFQSKNACEKNSCLSSTCQWVDVASNPQLIDYSAIFSSEIYSPLLTSAEMGSGYCVEKEYPKDDQCNLCSPGSNLFENYFCTSNVCASLGRCFANPEQTSCAQCKENPAPDATCYSYASEEECIGGGSVTKDEYELLTLSKDRCSWGRCSWDGASCFKDGDANKNDDCVDTKGDKVACAVDNTPPRTKAFIGTVINQQNPFVNFTVDDTSSKPGQQSPVKELRYCLSPVDGSNTCTSDKFVTVGFKGLLSKDSIAVNITAYPFLTSTKASGEVYNFFYFSKDIYSNQELRQKVAVYVDAVAPDFEIKESPSTQGIVSQLEVHLENSNEAMACVFALKQVLPTGEIKTVTVGRTEQNKEASFTDLKGVKYQLMVTCTDDHGNVNVKQKEYSFDLEQNINIIYPQKGQIVVAKEVAFKVQTQLSSTCSLYDASTNQKIADFVTDESGLVHETAALQFIEKEYVAAQKVVCQELLTSKSHEDYFDFKIDFTPPSVSILLTEESRSVAHQDDGWIESFILQAGVSLQCSSSSLPCQKIMYCLGADCNPADTSSYLTYTSPFVVDKTNKICYFAVHEGLLYNDVSCGEIHIDGFGITLEKPTAYTYNDEIWGISNSPTFDWQFYTKLSTQECRFDFIPTFAYDTLAPYKVKEKNGNDKYLFEAFPVSVFSDYGSSGGVKEVYLICKNGEGKFSPLQKMNLEYDPTVPEIKSVSADPNPIIEGVSTLLTVTTDDKTVCWFRDNDDGSVKPFPGRDEHQLDTTHKASFYVGSGNFVDGKKEYTLSVQCENGAGNLSLEKNITINVDYTKKGSIVSIWPRGDYLSGNLITAEVVTSKLGYCEYKQDDHFVLFDETNTKIHHVKLNASIEGEYSIPFRCFFGDAAPEEVIKYTIDRQAPIINSIDDGNVTCGLDTWSVYVNTNETAIANYSYVVYNATPSLFGSSTAITNTTTFKKGEMLYQGGLDSESTLKVPLTDLSVDKNKSQGLIVSIKVTDKAGNVGQVKESNGVLLTAQNYSTCAKDSKKPVVTFSEVNGTSCTSREVSLPCTDATGCQNFIYGLAPTADKCSPTQSYNGKEISVTSTSYLCFKTKDAVNNSKAESKLITFEDADGDKVADSCDQCKGSLAGKVVDSKGCAIGQVNGAQAAVDSDDDGLPDSWEKQFDSALCLLSHLNKDSNTNGLNDGQEDYDSDGLMNYKEYSDGKNPCLADVAETKKEEVVPSAGTVPSSEPSNTLAWVLLLLGFVLFLGGLGYLVYLYLQEGEKKSARSMMSPRVGQPALGKAPEQERGWTQQFATWKKAREERAKEKGRTSIFSEFGKSSTEIPHVQEALRGKSLSGLQSLAQKYTEHKEEIKPGLQATEKNIFDRLEKIGQQTKKKDITEVVSKKEADDIFTKLQKISKKRKEQ